jgi:hypothetical protein
MSLRRLLRRSFGISAPRMAVRPDVPWHWRSLRIAAWAGVLVSGGWLVLNTLGGPASAGRDLEAELTRLQASVERQETELAALRSRNAQNERQLEMERAAGTDLAKQVKALTFENSKLKEDLAFFQSLMSGGSGREGALTVNRFRLQPEAAEGEYRYQMLLVQHGPKSKEFHGTLQFVLDVQHDGRKVALVLPADAEREAREYQLNFKFFQRVEGTFKLAPGSVLKGMQVRVFENGTRAPKLTQTLSVS